MPQQKNDWQNVDDWQDVPATPSRPLNRTEQAIVDQTMGRSSASPGFLDSVADYIPSPVKSLWRGANVSAFDYLPESIDPSHFARQVTESLDPENRDPYYASTITRGAGDVVHSLASPLNAAMTILSGGGGTVARAGYPLLGAGMRALGGALSVPVAAEGAYNMATGETWPETIGGAVQLGGGLLGMKEGIPKIGEVRSRFSKVPSNRIPEEAPTTPHQVGSAGSKFDTAIPLEQALREAEANHPTVPAEQPTVPAESPTIMDQIGEEHAPWGIFEREDLTPEQMRQQMIGHIINKHGADWMKAIPDEKPVPAEGLNAFPAEDPTAAEVASRFFKPTETTSQAQGISEKPWEPVYMHDVKPSTGSPLADMVSERVGKNAPERKGKVKYQYDRGHYIVDYDNPHPVTGAFPAERWENGQRDPFFNYTIKSQLPFIEDVDRMYRERNTIDVTPSNPNNKALPERPISTPAGEPITGARPKSPITEERVVYDREGNKTVLSPEEADSYEPSPGETYGVEKSNGTFVLLNDLGGTVPDELRMVRPRRREYPGLVKKPNLAEAMASRTTDATIGSDLEASLRERLASKARTSQPQRTPLPTMDFENLDPNIPIKERPPLPEFQQSRFSDIWNVPRALQSIDMPGVTSAALRQSRPLAFTSDWFKAWGEAYKAFGSKGALDEMNAALRENKYFKPKYLPIQDAEGNVISYKELPSVAENLGVRTTDLLNRREEAIVSPLAERIPGYGRYVKASNRAYTAFLNHLRVNKFSQLMDGAYAVGRDPIRDQVLGNKLATYVNNATGRGSLKFGEKLNLEPIAEALGDTLYSPRALAARLSFMNPKRYTFEDPMVRKEYWKSMASLGVSWGAFAGLGSLAGGVTSFDPTNADFGKIRFGNTRVDPGAGFQQLLVLGAREAMGGTTSSTGLPGEPGKFSRFGQGYNSPTRLSTAGRYLYNQLHPSLRMVFDLANANSKDPLDLTDRSLQLVLPMYITDIFDAAAEDENTAAFFAPLLSSAGTGVQSYEKGKFNAPKITPFVNDVLGTEVPTVQVGR